MAIFTMTKEQWNATHKDYKGKLNGRKAILTESGLRYVAIVKSDWYANSSEQDRVALINQYFANQDWLIEGNTAILNGCLYAKLEAERARYLELHFEDKLVYTLDMRGFNARNIKKYMNELQAVINKHLTVVGAHCETEYLDNKGSFNAYFSFGDYNDKTHTDSYGIDDDYVFFYADKGEADLKSFLVPGAEDFIIKSYELSYRWLV